MDVKEIQKREAEGISLDYATEHPVYMLRSALAFGEKLFQLYLYYTYSYHFNFILRPWHARICNTLQVLPTIVTSLELHFPIQYSNAP